MGLNSPFGEVVVGLERGLNRLPSLRFGYLSGFFTAPSINM